MESKLAGDMWLIPAAAVRLNPPHHVLTLTADDSAETHQLTSRIKWWRYWMCENWAVTGSWRSWRQQANDKGVSLYYWIESSSWKRIDGLRQWQHELIGNHAWRVNERMLWEIKLQASVCRRKVFLFERLLHFCFIQTKWLNYSQGNCKRNSKRKWL